jgi:hypothetical protein
MSPQKEKKGDSVGVIITDIKNRDAALLRVQCGKAKRARWWYSFASVYFMRAISVSLHLIAYSRSKTFD